MTIVIVKHETIDPTVAQSFLTKVIKGMKDTYPNIPNWTAICVTHDDESGVVGLVIGDRQFVDHFSKRPGLEAAIQERAHVSKDHLQ